MDYRRQSPRFLRQNLREKRHCKTRIEHARTLHISTNMARIHAARPRKISDAQSRFFASAEIWIRALARMPCARREGGWGEGARRARGASGRKPDLTRERSVRRTSSPIQKDGLVRVPWERPCGACSTDSNDQIWYTIKNTSSEHKNSRCRSQGGVSQVGLCEHRTKRMENHTPV